MATQCSSLSASRGRPSPARLLSGKIPNLSYLSPRIWRSRRRAVLVAVLDGLSQTPPCQARGASGRSELFFFLLTPRYTSFRASLPSALPLSGAQAVGRETGRRIEFSLFITSWFLFQERRFLAGPLLQVRNERSKEDDPQRHNENNRQRDWHLDVVEGSVLEAPDDAHPFVEVVGGVRYHGHRDGQEDQTYEARRQSPLALCAKLVRVTEHGAGHRAQRDRHVQPTQEGPLVREERLGLDPSHRCGLLGKTASCFTLHPPPLVLARATQKPTPALARRARGCSAWDGPAL
mmetsp:Transcript_8405/g.28822  ORF Transcript_8405/g.28822 Transcript_8405/m.28822 type:complete len:291 (+) Transcript_8405:5541-6413(+)